MDCWSAPIFWSTSALVAASGVVGLPLPAAATSAGVCCPSAPCGRSLLYSTRHASIWSGAPPPATRTSAGRGIRRGTAVERLDEGIVGRLARATEDELHAAAVRPGIQRLGDELRAIVHAEALRAPARSAATRSKSATTCAPGQRRPGRHGRTHPAHVIHERQDPEAPSRRPAGRLRKSMPALRLRRAVATGRGTRGTRSPASCASCAAAPAPPAGTGDRPACGSPRQPSRAAGRAAADSRSAPAPPPGRAAAAAGPPGRPPDAPVALDRATEPEDPAGAPLAEREADPQERHELAVLGRLQRFFG